MVKYGVNEKKKRTLIDDQKYELDSASGANSTENAGKQKQRDKRTRIKNMTL